MKILFKKTFAILGILGLSLGWLFTPGATANSAQDCDSNAVIYCGIEGPGGLVNALNYGTGRQYQSGAELRDLFGYYRIYAKDAYKLKSGYVTSDNRVVVPGYTVKNGTNVYSMGRSYMPGSTRVSRFPYPIYLRHPSVSFRSNSIPALVYMNPDSTFAYAVIMSCGNIVPGKLYNPEPNHFLEIRKWHDLNRDNRKQTSEPYLNGWSFTVTGNGINKTVTTGNEADGSGRVFLRDLPSGTYTVSEQMQDNWIAVTNPTRTITLTENKTIYFGNYYVRPSEPRYNLEIRKYHDENQDGDRDLGESYLPGWEFRVEGLENDYDEIIRTNASGVARASNLEAGRYRITEVSQPDWITITNPIQTVTIDRNREIEFGNYLPELIQLRVVKFHDRDGDARLDGGEEGLEGWRFRVTSDRGFNQIITTDFSGDYTLTDLEPANYTVTEILRDGWENTTGLTITRNVNEDPTTQVFLFGNRQEEEDPEDPEDPGGGDLPESGPAEAAAMAFGSMSLSGGALAWLRSKKNLLAAIKK